MYNKEYQHKWYEEHKEQIRERRRVSNQKYYKRHKEQILEQKREYRERTRDIRHLKEHIHRKPYLNVYLDAGNELICNRCGSSNKLGIHHKDGNHNNNLISNLECLCDSCHAKEHNERRRRNERGQYTSEVAEPTRSV